MDISYTFTFRFDAVMRNYTVYDGLMNWFVEKEKNMAARLARQPSLLAAPNAYA